MVKALWSTGPKCTLFWVRIWCIGLAQLCKTLFKIINTATARLVYNFYIGRLSSQVNVVYWPRPMKETRKPSCRWQTRATQKHAKSCSNSTCLQRCRWQYWPISIRLAVVAPEICEISRNSLKIQTYGVQSHPRLSILVSVESPYVTSY